MVIVALLVALLPVISAAKSGRHKARQKNPTIVIEVRCPSGMSYIPPVEFDLGCGPTDLNCVPDELPTTRISLTRGYCIDQFEVTEASFARAMNKARMFSKECGFGCPVVDVDWNEAKSYCEKKGKRLPTEAEWEFAARGGGVTTYYWGNEMSGRFAWYSDNSAGFRHPVGQKLPNGFMLYDMLGNAREWVRDCYLEKWYKIMPLKNPVAEISQCPERVIRGGSAVGVAVEQRASRRVPAETDFRDDFTGFRCALDAR
jgi:formylglycine-generating enzyme required for sulfatase activity